MDNDWQPINGSLSDCFPRSANWVATSSGYSCRLEGNAPQNGLTILNSKGTKVAQWFSLPQFPLMDSNKSGARDIFQRHGHLMCWTESTREQPVEFLQMFRVGPVFGGLAGLENQVLTKSCLWVESVLSIQTSLWDAKPLDQLEFQVFEDGHQRWEPESILLEPSQTALESYHSTARIVWTNNAEDRQMFLVHNTDLRDYRFDRSGDTSLRLNVDLIGARLEKGVIRRYRSLACIGPNSAREKMTALAMTFEQSRLPLST